MTALIRRSWPECILVLVAGFFFLRELGTFPAAFIDDSLYMIAAKSIAAGNEISLPILGKLWKYPSVLHVGPPLLYPVVWSIQLFGFSIEAARYPMIGYLIATSLALYLFTKYLSGKNEARWATALLITLSAFVNTGKPVMGEVPGFFFLLLGIFLIAKQKHVIQYAALAGLCICFALLSKTTFIVVLPAIVIAWLYAGIRKQWNEVLYLTIILSLSVGFFIPFKILELDHSGGLFLGEYVRRFSANDEVVSSFLQKDPAQLLRFPYLYFATLFGLASVGIRKKWEVLTASGWLITVITTLLFMLYFLGGPGWYRHLLPAHLLLLAFVPSGASHLLKNYGSTALLLFFVLAQSYWQLNYFGANRSTAAAAAAHTLEENYREEKMIIRQAEVYVRLSENENWLFLSHEALSSRFPPQFSELTPTQKCLPQLVKMSQDDSLSTATFLNQGYAVIDPPDSCL